MADDQDKLTNKEEIKPPEFNPGIPEITGTSTKKINKEMDIHHHPIVHEQQGWKEYIFHFLMLFLAVFLAFLAENKREHNLESEKESEYIESLAKDAQVDFTTSEDLRTAIFIQVKKIDTLQNILFDDLENSFQRDSLIRKSYELSSSILTFYPAFFNERTITQLLSSGNMRLIKKQGVADSIMDYHSFIKFVEVQKQLYVNSVNTSLQSMYNIFDITYLKSIMRNDTLFEPDNSFVPVKLLTTSPEELKKFIATLEITKLVAFTYKNYLTEMTKRASRLYYFLRDKYKLKKI